MSGGELLERARAVGLTVTREGDQLHARADFEPDPNLVAELREHKADILDTLRAEEADRRQTIEAAVENLFSRRPEFRERRVGQITCTLYFEGYIDFPVKDAEVAAVLAERSIVAMAKHVRQIGAENAALRHSGSSLGGKVRSGSGEVGPHRQPRATLR